MRNTSWTRKRLPALAGLAGLLVLGATLATGTDPPLNYSQQVLKSRPVAYWRLGESQGSTARDAAAQHPGTYLGMPLLGVPGALKGDRDTAIQLNGKTAYVEIPAHADFSQPTSGKGLTVEVWMRPDVLEFEGEKDGYLHWMGKGEPGKTEWALRFYSRKSKRPNRISAYLFNLAGGLGAGAYFEDPLTAGEWIHVVACFEPGDADSPNKPGVHIYRDGKHRLGPPSAGTLYNDTKWQIRPSAGTAPVRLGTFHHKSFFSGALDEVAIYPRVLTAAEIKSHYEAGRIK